MSLFDPVEKEMTKEFTGVPQSEIDHSEHKGFLSRLFNGSVKSSPLAYEQAGIILVGAESGLTGVFNQYKAYERKDGAWDLYCIHERVYQRKMTKQIFKIEPNNKKPLTKAAVERHLKNLTDRYHKNTNT